MCKRVWEGVDELVLDRLLLQAAPPPSGFLVENW
jgi:hypothetical protein